MAVNTYNSKTSVDSSLGPVIIPQLAIQETSADAVLPADTDDVAV
jgi:hypothetical protein